MAALLSRAAGVANRLGRRRQVILHIGRNKVGSTTIQDFCLARRHELLDRGVDYVMFGHLADSQPGVRGFATFEELMADVRARPGLSRLVSNEFMFAWPDAFTEAAAKALAGADVRIIAYVRPYADWLVSAYAEETRRGMNMRDIDDYLVWMWPRISAWPHLRKWGECFGWKRLTVRALSPGALWRGDLTADFLHAAGLSMQPREWPRSNVAPHWIELELIRQLAERNGDTEWAGVAAEEAEPLLAELRPLLAQAPSATYLSLAQRRSLAVLYNEDLERIRRAGGARLAPAYSDLGVERPFTPSLARAPVAVLRAFFERIGRPAFSAGSPKAADRARRLRAELSRLDAAGGRPAPAVEMSTPANRVLVARNEPS